MLCLQYEVWRPEIFQFCSEFYILDDRIIGKKTCLHTWTMFKSFLDKDFKAVTSCAFTAVKTKRVRGMSQKPRQGGIRGVEGKGSVTPKQRNISSPGYPKCPGFTAGYSRCKMQGVTPRLNSSFLFQNQWVRAERTRPLGTISNNPPCPSELLIQSPKLESL